MEAGLVTESTRFACLGLQDPPKHGAEEAGRRLRVLLLDTADGASRDVTVSPTESQVTSHRLLDAASDGQLPVLDEEFGLVEEILAKDGE